MIQKEGNYKVLQNSYQEVKSCFKPNPIMDLTWEESRLSAYIFNDQLDLDEELFMIGDEIGTRREFLSLATGRDINEKIFILLAKLRTHVERHGDSPITTWYLPPSFSIYVPIVEDNIHRYLMVVDIDDYTIYKLDTWDMKCYRERRYLDIAKLSEFFGVGYAQWLEMENSFMSTVIGELHDENVRMKNALKLVKHDMNKMKKEVKTKCTLIWSKLPFI
ncbi:hypothetical protein Lal_00026578 [Lupinus albus]|nr:hypothetical protein Lal_00026578 [Lupinus albus]